MLVIFLIPLIVNVLALFLRIASGPFWQNCDPSYDFLFDGLDLVNHKFPHNIAHPGTPLQSLYMFVVHLFNLGQSPQTATHNVLLNPEFYVFVTYHLLWVFLFVTAVALGWYVYHKTKDTWAVICTQLPLLGTLAIQSFDATYPIRPVMANVGSEMVLVSITNLFSLSFLMLYFSDDQRKETKAAICLGFCSGLGLAMKLTFLPFLVPIVFLLSWKNRFIFAVTVIFSFVLWTLPIVPIYGEFFAWLKTLLSQKEIYSDQKQGLIEVKPFLNHLFKDIFGNFMLFVLLAVGSVAYSLMQMIQRKGSRRVIFLLATALGICLQFLVVAKYYGAHYLVPTVAFCSALFFFLYMHLAKHSKTQRIAVGLALVFGLFFITQTITYGMHTRTFYKEFMNFHDRVYNNYGNCRIIESETNYFLLYLSQPYALFWGNKWAFNLASEDLSRMHPYYYYFNNSNAGPHGIDGYGIWNASKRIFADDIVSADQCTVFISGGDVSGYPFILKPVETSRFANAYLLTGSTEKEAENMFKLGITMGEHGHLQQAVIFLLRAKELHFRPVEKVNYFIKAVYGQLNHQK